MPAPPSSAEQLQRRVRALAGRTLAEVAHANHMPVPLNLRAHKGWIGHVLERALGADAGGKAAPDFAHLGIELKTLPVTPEGRVLESTWVCTLPLDGRLSADWSASWVREKLARVLFVPILGDRGSPPGDRRIGSAFLWSPSAEEEAVLADDWRTIADKVALGAFHELHARHGRALQVRPKGADASQAVWVMDAQGEPMLTQARGFYLRPAFTSAVLARALRLPGH